MCYRLVLLLVLTSLTIGCRPQNLKHVSTGNDTETQKSSFEIPDSIAKSDVIDLVKDASYDEQGCGETSTYGYPDIHVPWSSKPVYVTLEFANNDQPPKEQLIGFSGTGFQFRETDEKQLLIRVDAD